MKWNTKELLHQRVAIYHIDRLFYKIWSLFLLQKEKESRQELAQAHIHNSKSNLQTQNQYG